MQADSVINLSGCMPDNTAGDLYDEGFLNCENEHDYMSSGSEEIDPWRCLPDEDAIDLPYEVDAAPTAPVACDACIGDDAIGGETLMEGQASAGGDTGTPAAVCNAAVADAAAAAAATKYLDRDRGRHQDSSRAEGEVAAAGTAAVGPQRSSKVTSGLVGNDDVQGEKEPQLPTFREAGGGGRGKGGWAGERDAAATTTAEAATALEPIGVGGAIVDGTDGGSDSNEDRPLALRRWQIVRQAATNKTRGRGRQTARKADCATAMAAAAMRAQGSCRRCGGVAGRCGGSDCPDGGDDVNAVPPLWWQQAAATVASPPIGAPASRTSSDACAKRRRIDDSAAGGDPLDFKDDEDGDAEDAIEDEVVSGPRPEDLRTLPPRGWGELTPAASELLRRLAGNMGMDRSEVPVGLYVVDVVEARGGRVALVPEPLAERHPSLAEEVRSGHIPQRMCLQTIHDPCHPVYNNDMVFRNTEPKQRMLVYKENLHAQTPLGAYFGTVKTLAENDEYVLADVTQGRQLMEAYTHTCDWTEWQSSDSKKLVVVGDTRRCLMAYANEIRFWGTCEQLWGGVRRISEEVRRTGCRCGSYKGRTASAECVQGIAKWLDRHGKPCYSFFILYYTSKEVVKGEEALISWDDKGTFFNAIREAVKTNQFYKRLQGRLRARAEQLAEETARRKAVELERQRQAELAGQRERQLEQMQSDLAAFKLWRGSRLEVAAAAAAAPLPPELSYCHLLDELYELRAEKGALGADRQAGQTAASQLESCSRELVLLRSELEEERAAREEVEQQLAASRATANMLLVQLDGCQDELIGMRGKLAAAEAVAAAAAAWRGRIANGSAGRGGVDRRRRHPEPTSRRRCPAAEVTAATAAATTGTAAVAVLGPMVMATTAAAAAAATAAAVVVATREDGTSRKGPREGEVGSGASGGGPYKGPDVQQGGEGAGCGSRSGLERRQGNGGGDGGGGPITWKLGDVWPLAPLQTAPWWQQHAPAVAEVDVVDLTGAD